MKEYKDLVCTDKPSIAILVKKFPLGGAILKDCYNNKIFFEISKDYLEKCSEHTTEFIFKPEHVKVNNKGFIIKDYLVQNKTLLDIEEKTIMYIKDFLKTCKFVDLFELVSRKYDLQSGTIKILNYQVTEKPMYLNSLLKLKYRLKPEIVDKLGITSENSNMFMDMLNEKYKFYRKNIIMDKFYGVSSYSNESTNDTSILFRSDTINVEMTFTLNHLKKEKFNEIVSEYLDSKLKIQMETYCKLYNKYILSDRDVKYTYGISNLICDLLDITYVYTYNDLLISTDTIIDKFNTLFSELELKILHIAESKFFRNNVDFDSPEYARSSWQDYSKGIGGNDGYREKKSVRVEEYRHIPKSHINNPEIDPLTKDTHRYGLLITDIEWFNKELSCRG